MSQTYRLVCFALCLMAGVSSCKVETLDEPIIISLVDQEFTLNMLETLQPSSADLSLDIELTTNEDVTCLNTEILTGYSRIGRSIELTLFEILKPEVCDPGMAPAQGKEVIDELEVDLYRLRVELQDVVSNAGWLTITNDTYRIEMEEENGINWLHYELRRIPQDMLWGYLTYANETEQLAANDFVATLTDMGQEATLSDGHYGYFSVLGAGTNVAIRQMPDQAEVIPFLIKYTGNTAAIDQKVEEYLSTLGENAAIRLWDREGNKWSN